MNRQAIFNNAYIGLENQGFKKSLRQQTVLGANCAYRSEDGTKCCAIGHNIPDDKYDPRLEGLSARDYEVRRAMNVGLISEDDQTFLSKLQECHDCSTGYYGMEERLIVFANEYNLSIPEKEI